MLEQEVASIHHFIAKKFDIEPYFESVPKDMIMPCIFYPTPEVVSDSHSLSAYVSEFVMYASVFAVNTLNAYELASGIEDSILANRCKVELYNLDGKPMGKRFRLNFPKIKKIEEGVYQIEFSWKRYVNYNMEK